MKTSFTELRSPFRAPGRWLLCFFLVAPLPAAKLRLKDLGSVKLQFDHLGRETVKAYRRESDPEAVVELRKEMVKFKRRLERMDGSIALWLYYRVWLEFNSQNLIGAEKLISGVLEEDPYLHYALHLKYWIHRTLQYAPEDLEGLVKEIKNKNPDRIEAAYFLCDLKIYSGELPEALRQIETALSMKGLKPAMESYFNRLKELVGILEKNPDWLPLTRESFITAPLAQKFLGMALNQPKWLSRKTLSLPAQDSEITFRALQPQGQTDVFMGIYDPSFALNRADPFAFLSEADFLLSGFDLIFYLDAKSKGRFE